MLWLNCCGLTDFTDLVQNDLWEVFAKRKVFLYNRNAMKSLNEDLKTGQMCIRDR